MTNPNDSAYPIAYTSAGLTKREYFAALTFQAQIASGKILGEELMANVAVRRADHLIAALNKETEDASP